MGGYIPEDVLESIRLRVDIVGLISNYVNLQKKGANYVGSCPFHQESDPSFTVTPAKQIFYCFGCHQGGNAFKFIMLQHQLSFPEAVRFLGEQVGITVPDNYSPQVRKRIKRHERAGTINQLAKEYFQRVFKKQDEAAIAREYLSQRGLDPSIINEFGIGYAPARWDGLIKFMDTQGYTTEDLVEVGLAVRRKQKNGAYDRFRSRLMFPIADYRGRIVGFGGRVIGEGTPKYLNTPETQFFSKSKVLYGLDKARSHINNVGYVIITEGYLDVITAHQFGLTNTVASLGTSLTKEHGDLLKNHAQEVLIAYDADAAGVAATMRGLDLLQELGCRIRVISLPLGTDPDDFLRQQGLGAWQQKAEQAVSLIEFKLQTAFEKYQESSWSKQAILDEVLPSLAAIQGELEKNEMVKLVASRLYTSYHAVAEQLKKVTHKRTKTNVTPDKYVKNRDNITSQNRVDFGLRAEYGLLKLVLEDVNTIDHINISLTGNFFKDDFCRQVYDIILNCYRQPSFSPALLFDHLEEKYQQKLGMLLVEPVPGDDLDELLQGLICAIQRKQLMERRNDLLRKLELAEKSGDGEEVLRILHDINNTEKP